jgi:hypothetical protein
MATTGPDRRRRLRPGGQRFGISRIIPGSGSLAGLRLLHDETRASDFLYQMTLQGAQTHSRPHLLGDGPLLLQQIHRRLYYLVALQAAWSLVSSS